MPPLPPALLLVLAIVAGAAMDATIKHLAQNNHVLAVTFGRYLFGALFSFFIWLHAGRPRISAAMWRAHGLRGFVIAGCAVTFFWALTVLPLAQAVTLSFIYPLLVPFVAWPMLGERPRPSSIVAAVVGFAGVLLAAQGAEAQARSSHYALGVAAVLASATLFSFSMVLLRARAQTDGAPIVGLMTSVVPGAIIAIPALVFASPPRMQDWFGFLQLGALAAVFMYLMARAYAKAEAQRLAPIHYTELLWAGLIGYIVFHETPAPQLYLGAALIIAACLYVAYDERRLATTGKEATP